ncbi:hypothetical protein FQR65_LT16453 [Abscondita terminalis]|nr:hypothetical protein FQR65_LT16453 [Abscondita terminalis]
MTAKSPEKNPEFKMGNQQQAFNIEGLFQIVENKNLQKTEYGWEIDPVGFRMTSRALHERYGLPIIITENGLGAKDVLTEDGKIHDDYRIELGIREGKMEKIKIYAPVDGEIDLIENLKDGVFSEKMLGDGFYIKPTSNKFYSPIENGKVKTGDLIGEFIFSEVKEELNIKDQIEEIINSKSRYEIAAETIYKAVGTHSNYTKVFNCMTRLRFEVKNKESINELEIKRLPIVKGIIWSGNQMQIVIGGEVYKVREAVEDYVIKITSGVETKIKSFKPSIGKRILGAITGIILPSLPVLMAGGLLMGIKTILVVSGAIVDLSSSTNSGVQPDLFSYAFNIVAESGIKLLGIYMGYNTMKYLGGPTLLSIFMGIALSGATTVQFTTIMPS